MTCPDTDSEAARLDALRRYDILDTEPEEAFDRITRLARTVLDLPMVLVSLLDAHRQWFKSRQGVTLSETPREISFCSHAIKGAEPLLVTDAQADPRFACSPLVTGEPHIRFYVGVPLRTRDGHAVGTLCAMDTKVRQLRGDQVRLLEDLARLVVDELELRLLAAVDSLTGAMTRRSFREHAEGDVARARRYGNALTCAAIDIDNFKPINDAFGHAAGDFVLQRVVAICQGTVRQSDYVGRLGGDEFAVMLPETLLVNAFAVADRLRRNIEQATIEYSGSQIHITVSVGLAEHLRSGNSVDQLIKDADAALYDAKLDGKNRVACHLEDLEFISEEELEAAARAGGFDDDARKECA